MSLWELRFHDTAKMPEPVRRAALRNGHKQLDFLLGIRNQAIPYASSEDIRIYASFVQLPPITPDEAESSDSWEHGSDGDSEATTEHESDQEQENDDEDPWDAQAAASATAMDEADAVDSQDHTRSDEHAGNANLADAEIAVDETFDHDMKALAAALPSASTQAQASTTSTTTAESSVTTNSFLTNDPGRREGHSGQSLGGSMDVDPPSPNNTQGTITEGTNTDDNLEGNSPKWLTNTPGAPYNNEMAASSSNANSTADQEGREADADSVGEVEDQAVRPNNIHVPIYRRPSTLHDTPPTWADEYKKFFDKAFEIWSIFYHTRAPRPLRARLGDIRTHDAAVRRYNLINLGLYPCVTAGHLIELKRRIDDVSHFCDFLTCNIMEIDIAKNLRRDVLYTYPCNSPLRLRTKGLGSSLRFVTNVDEGWVDPEDNWGMPPPPKQRIPMPFHPSQNASW
ncbi:unnamed protein product [Fusarium fujikuroi]|uniref:Uncharacterized protein n=1 Tax=Fusarium fujikuroi TaxID=5127 RepID=A0A9Q9RH08_FUSFU|nr:unnamed protein product [Fusarium fujikuroi]VTT61026.1 unnamed protein product [Fusarium fujikuroi]VZH89887.1 unnamed protein product [Fusarium fujikuroi]